MPLVPQLRDAAHVRREDVRLSVPQPRDRRGGRRDLAVDRAPRVRALLRPDGQLGSCHRVVDRRILELWPVRVVLGADVVAVEGDVEHRLRVGEVADPADVRAGVDSRLRQAAEACVHDRAVDELEVRLEAEVLQRLLEDLRVVAVRRAGEADDLERLAAGVSAARVAGRLQLWPRALCRRRGSRGSRRRCPAGRLPARTRSRRG